MYIFLLGGSEVFTIIIYTKELKSLKAFHQRVLVLDKSYT